MATPSTALIRGNVYYADIGHGRKPFLVVSNNRRNRNLDEALVVRITTTDKKIDLPTIVPLTNLDPLVGWALCDDVTSLYSDEQSGHAGALSVPTMEKINDGLRAALDL